MMCDLSLCHGQGRGQGPPGAQPEHLERHLEGRRSSRPSYDNPGEGQASQSPGPEAAARKASEALCGEPIRDNDPASAFSRTQTSIVPTHTVPLPVCGCFTCRHLGFLTGKMGCQRAAPCAEAAQHDGQAHGLGQRAGSRAPHPLPPRTATLGR